MRNMRVVDVLVKCLGFSYLDLRLKHVCYCFLSLCFPEHSNYLPKRVDDYNCGIAGIAAEIATIINGSNGKTSGLSKFVVGLPQRHFLVLHCPQLRNCCHCPLLVNNTCRLLQIACHCWAYGDEALTCV